MSDRVLLKHPKVNPVSVKDYTQVTFLLSRDPVLKYCFMVQRSSLGSQATNETQSPSKGFSYLQRPLSMAQNPSEVAFQLCFPVSGHLPTQTIVNSASTGLAGVRFGNGTELLQELTPDYPLH